MHKLIGPMACNMAIGDKRNEVFVEKVVFLLCEKRKRQKL